MRRDKGDPKLNPTGPGTPINEQLVPKTSWWEHDSIEHFINSSWQCWLNELAINCQQLGGDCGHGRSKPIAKNAENHGKLTKNCGELRNHCGNITMAYATLLKPSAASGTSPKPNIARGNGPRSVAYQANFVG